MPSRYLVIHGHFYQPPRENPWVLAIEPQDSAEPFANWNLRVNRECYAPNTRSHLLSPAGRIKKINNNYKYLSFNFGPTLLSWLEKADPGTYRQIIQADRQAARCRGGHGSALAQVYNHLIMPLANDRDRLTQIRWGAADFEARFGRRPEGMWLAETAVDLKTLGMLAREGIKFTVLSQGQAAAVRPLGVRRAGLSFSADQGVWQDVSGGRIDPREPYRVFWGPGSDDFLDVFFYDGPVSRAIAFESLLSDGARLLERVEMAFGQPRKDGGPRLVSLATDGESYGHHFTFGDMALTWLFDHLEQRAGKPEAIELTNYGHFLSLFPPTREVQIIDNTSWSCAHGVERWRSDCGCNTGGGDGRWNQKWRRPLRDGLDWLRDQLAAVFEDRGRVLLKDPWAARDDYIRLILSFYDPATRDGFIKAHQARPLTPEETTAALSLLEAQLMGLYMFTSCGWFFDEVSGLEPVQNLRYALRAIELAQPFTETDLTGGLGRFLETIVPNDPEYPTGLEVWKNKVASGSLSSRDLAAHWAAATLLDVPEMMDFFSALTFKRQKAARLKGERSGVVAAKIDIHDPRLALTTTHLCLAAHNSRNYLSILTGEAGQSGTRGQSETPDWLDEDVLQVAFDERLKAPTILSIREFMSALMPLGSRYVFENLLPVCRDILLSSLTNSVYDHLKYLARDVFNRHQHLLLMKRGAGQSMNRVELFIFRVMGENELQRILLPAGRGRPINLTKLATLLDRRGLIGLARNDSVVPEFCQAYLNNAFCHLAAGLEPGRLLAEVISFLQLIREEKFEFELWESQDQWYGLKNDRAWMARLSSEEAELMAELGDALGFALEEI